MARKMNLRALTFDDLLNLQERVSNIIAGRIKSERIELEARLARLQGIKLPSLRASAQTNGSGRRKKRKVAPKYRNPAKPSETWTGRGRQPRWMTAAIKSGKKRSSFLISRS